MKLRPHHLMCINNYKGLGYSNMFVKNMNLISNSLRIDPNQTINLTFESDDICAFCPNLLSKYKCSSNLKVEIMDNKMIKYFNLEEKEYIYSSLISSIKNKLTDHIFYDICLSCEWYTKGICKNFNKE